MFDFIFDSVFWFYVISNFVMLMIVSLVVRRSERKRAIAIQKRVVERAFNGK